MNAQHIKILLVEDNPGDARLVQEMINEMQLSAEVVHVKIVHARIMWTAQADNAINEVHGQDLCNIDKSALTVRRLEGLFNLL